MMISPKNRIVLDALDDTLVKLRDAKPEERSEEARCIAVTITEVEKARAYFIVYVIEVENGDYL